LALFELSKESSELENIEKNINQLIDLYKSNKDLKNFIKNPTNTFQEKFDLINKISALMNFSKNFKNFLSVLVVKRRLFFLDKIMNSFLKLSATKRGELNASLISSKELNTDEINLISQELSKSIGSLIKFNYKVDEDLIGGLKIQLGSLMIDTSIKNRLKKYEKLMMDN
jgi:F-type H+-transporting ATPase subunit delta